MPNQSVQLVLACPSQSELALLIDLRDRGGWLSHFEICRQHAVGKAHSSSGLHVSH
jgi:hypothetical protein